MTCSDTSWSPATAGRTFPWTTPIPPTYIRGAEERRKGRRKCVCLCVFSSEVAENLKLPKREGAGAPTRAGRLGEGHRRELFCLWGFPKSGSHPLERSSLGHPWIIVLQPKTLSPSGGRAPSVCEQTHIEGTCPAAVSLTANPGLLFPQVASTQRPPLRLPLASIIHTV